MSSKGDFTIFKCPNCGKTCEVGIFCTCENPVIFNVFEERRGKGFVVVGYKDKKGNVWRFR